MSFSVAPWCSCEPARLSADSDIASPTTRRRFSRLFAQRMATWDSESSPRMDVAHLVSFIYLAITTFILELELRTQFLKKCNDRISMLARLFGARERSIFFEVLIHCEEFQAMWWFLQLELRSFTMHQHLRTRWSRAPPPIPRTRMIPRVNPPRPRLRHTSSIPPSPRPPSLFLNPQQLFNPFKIFYTIFCSSRGHYQSKLWPS